MNEQQRAMLLAKMDIEKTHGPLGGFVFDHVLHTLKLMGIADEANDLFNGKDVDKLAGLDETARKRLKTALSTNQELSQKRTQKLITQSHQDFLKVMGKTGIKVTYGYSGNPKKPESTKSLLIGNAQGASEVDLSKWLKVGVQLK
jgi:hypothetical protein